MKPWDVQATVGRLRKTSGKETVEMGDSLTRASLEVLYASLSAQHPKAGEEKLLAEARKILWKRTKAGL